MVLVFSSPTFLLLKIPREGNQVRKKIPTCGNSALAKNKMWGIFGSTLSTHFPYVKSKSNATSKITWLQCVWGGWFKKAPLTAVLGNGVNSFCLHKVLPEVQFVCCEDIMLWRLTKMGWNPLWRCILIFILPQCHAYSWKYIVWKQWYIHENLKAV